MISAEASVGAAAHLIRWGCSEDRLDEVGLSTSETWGTFPNVPDPKAYRPGRARQPERIGSVAILVSR
jgi:hypothetical protein